MSLEPIAAAARAAGPEDDGLPAIRLDTDADAGGLVAWFGADAARGAARVVIRGEEAGVVERTALYGLVANRTLGWGDSIGATLPGHPAWEPIKLHCRVPGCPPVWALGYDAAAPPECTIHPGELLRPAQ